MFDYHDGPVREGLSAAAPDGIDLYFDNVGGEHLEAAHRPPAQPRPHRPVRRDLGLQRDRAAARAAQPVPGDRQAADAARLHHRRPRRPPARVPEEVGALVRDGRVQFRETVVEGGVEAAPQAFIDLLRGANTGKMVVKL